MKSAVIVKILIEDPEGKVLLLRRSATDNRRPLQWDLVGGWLDEGEDVIACIKREAIEETGIKLEDPKIVYTYMDPEDPVGVCNWVYLVDKLDQNQNVQISHEHSEFAWVDKEELLNKISYSLQRNFIEHVIKYDLWK